MLRRRAITTIVRGQRVLLCNGCDTVLRKAPIGANINVHREHYCGVCHPKKTRKPKRERDNQKVSEMWVNGVDSASVDEC